MLVSGFTIDRRHRVWGARGTGVFEPVGRSSDDELPGFMVLNRFGSLVSGGFKC